MAEFNHGNIANLTVASTDLSDWVTSVSFDSQREIKEVRPIGSNPVAKVVGPYSTTLSIEAANDPALLAIIAPLYLAGTPTSSTFDFENSGTGEASFAGSALIATLRADASGSDVATVRFTMAVDGTVTYS
jgi:hypothetical protein